MKAIFNAKEFNNLIARTKGIKSYKANKVYVLFEINGNCAEITTYNDKEIIVFKTDCTCDGKIVFRTVRDELPEIKGEECVITMENTDKWYVYFNGAEIDFDFAMINTHERKFDTIPFMAIPGSEFRQTMLELLPTVSYDDKIPCFNGIRFDIETKYAMSTDGYRMSYKGFLATTYGNSNGYNFPYYMANTLKKLIDKKDDSELLIKISGEHIELVGADYKYLSKSMDQRYNDVKKMIKDFGENFEYAIWVDYKAINSAVKEMLPITKENDSLIVSFQKHDNDLYLACCSGEEVVARKITHKNCNLLRDIPLKINLAVNINYLKDSLSVVKVNENNELYIHISNCYNSGYKMIGENNVHLVALPVRNGNEDRDYERVKEALMVAV